MLSTIYMACIICKSHDWYKMELLDPTLKMPLVQGHPVVFGQNIHYIRKELLILPEM